MHPRREVAGRPQIKFGACLNRSKSAPPTPTNQTNGQPQSRHGLILVSFYFFPPLRLLHFPSMESSAAGGGTPPRPSASAGASPPAPPPPPPPPRGWLAGLVSGAGRILAAVLGPEPSASGSGSISSAAASDGDSPSASCSPAWYLPPGLHGEGCNDATGTRLPQLAWKVSAFQALPLCLWVPHCRICSYI